MADGRDVVIAKRLLDDAKRHGFRFRRIAPGPDGPLWGERDSEWWQDTVYISGFWEPGCCNAVRRRKSSLVVPGELLVADRVSGDALNVLNVVITRWSI